MYNFIKALTVAFCLLTLTSCIELIDDLTLNSDGSGKFKYTINLSSSKPEVTSLLALDSIDGHRVPKVSEIKLQISQFEKQMLSQPGILNVNIESDWQNYIFKFSCDFDNLDNLQNALRNSVDNMNLNGYKLYYESNWINWSGTYLTRDIPNLVTDQLFNSKYIKEEELKFAKYTTISRFDKEITRFDNNLTILSKNKKAAMIQTDLHSLIINPNKLDDKIFISN